MPTKLFLLILAFFMSAASLYSQTENDFKKIREDIYQSWITYLNSLDSISGRYEARDTYSGGFEESSACLFVYSYPFIKVEQLNGENGVDKISVYNSDYSFRLQTASQETTIENISDLKPFKGMKNDWFDNKNVLQKVVSNRLNNAKLNLLGAPLRLFPFWLPPLMKDDRFVIESIEYGTEDGKKTAVITYTNGNPIEENPNLWLLKGSLTLLPDDYWLPVRAEGNILEGEEGTITVENSYDFSHTVPILAEQNRILVKSTETGTGRIIISDVRENITVSPEDFTLTRYGFSEPEFSNTLMSSRWIILIGLDICLLVIAFVLYGRRRRRSARQQKTSEE